MKTKKWRAVAVIALAWVLMSASPAPKPDTRENRVAQIRVYLKKANADKSVDQMIEKLLADTRNSIPMDAPRKQMEDLLVDLEAFYRTALTAGWLEEVTTFHMARHFTLEELAALTAFHASPAGRSVWEKTPKYLAGVGPEIQKYIRQKTAEWQKGYTRKHGKK